MARAKCTITDSGSDIGFKVAETTAIVAACMVPVVGGVIFGISSIIEANSWSRIDVQNEVYNNIRGNFGDTDDMVNNLVEQFETKFSKVKDFIAKSVPTAA